MTDYIDIDQSGFFDAYSVQEFLDHEAEATIHRTLWHCEKLTHDDQLGEDCDHDNGHYCSRCPSNIPRPVQAYEANLISSLTKNGMHAPAIDIDFAARLVPSRTKGHYHLYLEREMPWWKYRILLKVLAWCGIIEKGYYRASVERRMTLLRWNIDQWFNEGGEGRLMIAELLQIARRTATLPTTEPKEISDVGHR